jgi:hypothetical protein
VVRTIISRRRFLELAAVPPIAAVRQCASGNSSVSDTFRAGFHLHSGEQPSGQRSGLDDASALTASLAYLRRSFPDLQRHFIFEYYPWYGARPFRHWEGRGGFSPPVDISSTSMPLLGAYDSRDAATLERHARWIVGTGVGAINVSWWGRGSYEDNAVHLLMDVMRAHGIHVTFHIEPYAEDRGSSYASDILYLLREYGQRRHWDAFLMLYNADGTVGPVFKSFFTSPPREATDCHGVTQPVPNYTADDVWRRQTDLLRNELRRDFDHITLLSDSLEPHRTLASGFDGTALYNNFVEPSSWRRHAENFSASNLVFSFNVNPGFDAIPQREVDPDSCYRPPPFVPPTATLDFSNRRDRTTAMLLGAQRIRDCFRATIALQTDPALVNRGRGFFLVYVNSFNEWHEGHQFEPMKDFADLTSAERRVGYHNVDVGAYRLLLLKQLMAQMR